MNVGARTVVYDLEEIKMSEQTLKKENSFTEGSVAGSLIRFAIPVLGALILQAAYGAVDLLVVGQFGDATSISAVGSGSSFMQMVTFIITSLAMGATVVIGQYMGAKEPKKAGDAVGTTIIMFLIVGVVLMVVLELFAGPFMKLLKVPDESFNQAVTYVRICSAGILIIIAYNVISGVLRGVGNANLPLIFVAIACVFNIVGDLFFVGALKMDVAGAALATVLAQLVSVIASVIVLRKQKLPITFSMKQCRIYRAELGKILNVGVPIALQEATVQVSFLVVNTVINKMGLNQSAGYGIAQKIVTFIMLVPSSIMQSVSAFVAQNVGAGLKDRAKKGFFTAVIAGCSIGVIMFAVGFFGGSVISRIFSSDPDVIAQSAAYLRGFSPECILTCILFSSIGYFNGSGKSVPTMIQGISSAVCIRIPLSIFMAGLPAKSLTLVGLATPITSVYGIIFFLICFYLLKKGKI
jgi:putative MATE family efflux protein